MILVASEVNATDTDLGTLYIIFGVIEIVSAFSDTNGSSTAWINIRYGRIDHPFMNVTRFKIYACIRQRFHWMVLLQSESQHAGIEWVHHLPVITSDKHLWNYSPVNGLVSISPWPVWTLNILKLEQNGRCFSRKHFQLHGFERISSRNCICILIFDLRTYHEICSRTSNWR